MGSTEIKIKTHHAKEVLDITREIQEVVLAQSSESNMCHVFILHTTAAITTADLDPGTDMDYLAFIDHVTPQLQFRHPHNPEHAPDHIWASVIGPDVTIPVIDQHLVLGTWQRVVLIEMDGPRDRSIQITLH